MHQTTLRCTFVAIVVLVATFGSSESGKIPTDPNRYFWNDAGEHELLPGGGRVILVHHVKL